MTTARAEIIITEGNLDDLINSRIVSLERGAGLQIEFEVGTKQRKRKIKNKPKLNKYLHKRMIRIGQCKGESSPTE